MLKHAENLALQEGMLQETDDYRILQEERFTGFSPAIRLLSVRQEI